MKYKYTNPSYNGTISFPDNHGNYIPLTSGESIVLEEDYSDRVLQHRIIIEQINDEKKTDKKIIKTKEEN